MVVAEPADAARRWPSLWTTSPKALLWNAITAHRACRDARSPRTRSTTGGPAGALPAEVSTSSTTGGPTGAIPAEPRPPLIEPVEMPAARAPATRGSLCEPAARPPVARQVPSLRTRPPLIEPVEMPAARAPARPPVARQVPSLRGSRQARPPVARQVPSLRTRPPLIEPVEMPAARTPARPPWPDRSRPCGVSTSSTTGGAEGALPAERDHRSSSLSRCPQPAHLGSPRGPARDAARPADAREVGQGDPGPRQARRADLRAQVGRVPVHRVPGRRRGGADQPQHQAADPLLPRARRRDQGAAARAVRPGRRGLRRGRRQAGVRGAAGAHPPGQEPRGHAGREDPGGVRRVRPPGAGRRVVRRPAAVASAGRRSRRRWPTSGPTGPAT